MNDPEYILTDELETIVAAVKTALGLSVLDYQYGFIEELNETLKQMDANPTGSVSKFPLVYLAEPFTTDHGEVGIYGSVDADIFIINTTTKDWKAKERMTNNYKPILYPIRRELLNQIALSPVFENANVENIKHKTTKGYYWGEAQKSVLNDAVDCLKLSGVKLRIHDKQNCTPQNSF